MEHKPGLKQVLRATALLSGSSFVTILAGLATSKINAVILGPTGVGLYSLLLSVLGLAGLVVGFGVGTGLVRAAAKSVGEGRDTDTSALWSAAWILFWVLTLPASVALFVFRVQIATAVTGGQETAAGVAFVAAALVFSLAGGLHLALINAHHRVAALARYGIYAALLQASITIAFVVSLGRSGIPYAIATSQAANLALARTIALRQTERRAPAPLRRAISAAFGLLRFGGPYTLSQLAGTGARLTIPILVVRLFSESQVGYVRAASTIGITYMGFLTAAMAQDYYPRLAARANKPTELVRTANQQLEAVYMLAIPIIFLAIGLAPIVVPIVYTRAFGPAVGVLEWQLVGDLFKLTSWALAFIILAQGRSSAFFVTEATGGTLLVSTSLLGMKTFGLSGVGIGYAFTYLVYCIVVYAVVRASTDFRFSPKNARTLLWAATGVLAAKGVILVIHSSAAYAIPMLLGVVLAVRSGRAATRAWRTPSGEEAD